MKVRARVTQTATRRVNMSGVADWTLNLPPSIQAKTEKNELAEIP
jgi:hypothetical protein